MFQADVLVALFKKALKCFSETTIKEVCLHWHNVRKTLAYNFSKIAFRHLQYTCTCIAMKKVCTNTCTYDRKELLHTENFLNTELKIREIFLF